MEKLLTYEERTYEIILPHQLHHPANIEAWLKKQHGEANPAVRILEASTGKVLWSA